MEDFGNILDGGSIIDVASNPISGQGLREISVPSGKIADGLRVVYFEGSIADNKGVAFPIKSKARNKKWVLKMVSVELTEIPDATATTMTVMVEDAGGNDALSAAITFTEGTDIAGTVLDGAVATTANRVFTESEVVQVLVGGTSVTKGKFKGTAVFLEV